MINLEDHIAKLDTRLSRRKDACAAISLAMRCWQAYRFLEPSDEMKVYLQRANHAVVAAHRQNLAHVRLFALTIFIAIEAKHYDNANAMLDKAMNYKSFLRAHEPFYYGVFCFLYAYLELCQKRARSAAKHWRNLTEHITKDASPHYYVMQGLLHLAAEEYPEAYSHLTAAFRAGVNSVFLYEGLFRYYKVSHSGFEGTNILPVLTYAALRGANISDIAARYANTLSAAIAENPTAGEKLYNITKYPPLLLSICTNRINNKDLSAEAYAFYREAEKKQMFTPELFGMLIRAAYENNVQKINHYPMEKFLQSLPSEGILDTKLAVYVYHHLLTDPALLDLLPDAQSRIIQLGTRCLEAGIRGREANSIYHYLWERLCKLGITGADRDKAEEILQENLTRFELRTQEDSRVRYIYITEPEKRGMAVYEIADTPIEIEAVGKNAGYTCLGAGQRTILDEELTIRPMIGQANADLYHYFFQKGDRRFYLLAYLSNYYLSLETQPTEATPVFEALLLEKALTKSYRMRVLVALGRLHYNAASFDQALQCYGEVDEDALDNAFIEQILLVYLQTREYARAAKLLVSKQAFISDSARFDAINKLTTIQLNREEISKKIAPVGYNLLLKNFYSKDLVNLVLENFQASYSEWATLAQVIDEDNRSIPKLDARVLEAALSMSSFDEHAQRAFARLQNSPDFAQLEEEFAELATFEMLAKSTRPHYDVLGLLENLYFQNHSRYLAWGLADVYLRHSITTFKSEDIIREALFALEHEGILLPVFKDYKPASSPYIEKYQPFLYKSLPSKDCWLYYKIDDSPTYLSVPMHYVRYGIYVAVVPMFYNETLTYYFSEEMSSGSITTKEEIIKNSKPFLHENLSDPYYAINNAIINESMFKHDQVERQITILVKELKPVRARLL
ncbi:MAG: DUF5717 family protein [Defluviitaleaceae bacterium]|nr:DUF5717 family protein [Defluviitaleaceae bacterium]